jgi:TPR repeat protein
LLSLLATGAPAWAQQSAVQKCLSLPRADITPEAEYCQGILAANGIGRPQDQAGAFKHYMKAAQMGLAEAQAVVGAAYQRGWQGQRDLGVAAQWYGKAAAQGHAGAELNLGQMYAKGDGVPKDVAKARQLIQAAADQGLAPARQALAELDQGGAQPLPGSELWNQGIARYRAGDHAGAAKIILQAAQAGYPLALYEMGYLYENGDGVAQNMAEAARWYTLGAAQGEPSAEAALGQLYEDGNTVPNDWVSAATWYTKSAQQGNRMGEYRLGRAHEYGMGVPLNLDQAIAWYDKAAAQGDGKASYMAQFLRDNHGFDGSSRDEQEQAQLGPLILRWVAERPPLGAVFHNAAERAAFIRNLAANEERGRQQAEHNMQQGQYDTCRSAGGDNCHPPTTPAPR